MVTPEHTGLKSLIQHEAVHVWIGVAVILLGFFVEQGVQSLLHPAHTQRMVRIQFRDPFGRKPPIRVYIDSEEAPQSDDGSIAVTPAVHKIKAYYLDTSKPAAMTSEQGEHGAVLRPHLTEITMFTITVNRE